MATSHEKRIAYPQEGEVSVVLNAGDFQVAHNYLTVLIVLAQGSILLLQVREGAQLVLGASTHCKKPQDTQSESVQKRGTGTAKEIRFVYRDTGNCNKKMNYSQDWVLQKTQHKLLEYQQQRWEGTNRVHDNLSN